MRTVDADTLAHALGALPGEPRVVAAGNAATPFELLHAANRAMGTWRLFLLNAPPGIPDREGVRLETPFVGAGMRDRPNLEYLPARLSLVPRLFATTRPPDVVFLHTSTPQDGTVSLGIEVNVLPAAVEQVRARGGLVVAQVNRRMPYTFGDAQLAVADIDYAVEVDAAMPAPHVRRPDGVTAEIGERVAALVPDGATLQLGIGAVPDATLGALHDRQGLHVWSEMFSDGVLALERAGRLDEDAPLVASFCFGSADLYEWLDHNQRVRMVRTERCNDPAVIARQPLMTSVNTALEVDLFGQANAQRRGGRIYSGFGGQTDFIVGALHSEGGRAVIALRSWHPKADRSTVVPVLDGPATSFQQSHVVTEHGTADIFGCSQDEQARQLVERCAHPDARPALRDAAVRLGLG